MKKKTDITPNSRIYSALRLLSLRSKERQEALKMADRTCVRCGRKNSTAKGKECKVQAHHKIPPVWANMYEQIRKELLQTKHDYECLCVECHQEETSKQREKKMLTKTKKGIY